MAGGARFRLGEGLGKVAGLMGVKGGGIGSWENAGAKLRSWNICDNTFLLQV